MPVLGHDAGLGPLATGAAVSLLAATAAVIQPRAGHACDTGRLSVRTGLAAGLAALAALLALGAGITALRWAAAQVRTRHCACAGPS